MKTLNFKAFTIIEVLVALWILTIAVLGPLSAALNSTANTRDSKNTIIASYLAQEMFETLRFYRDTVYLRCISADATCVATTLPAPATDFENAPEAAWRIFKTTISNGGGAESCFVAENVAGCTYDVESFLNAPEGAPIIINANNASCLYLYRDDRKQRGLVTDSPTDGMYLCSNQGLDFTPTTFKRVVKITSILGIVPDPTSPAYDTLYGDDLRVEVEVSYSKINALTRKIKVVDFIRARP